MTQQTDQKGKYAATGGRKVPHNGRQITEAKRGIIQTKYAAGESKAKIARDTKSSPSTVSVVVNEEQFQKELHDRRIKFTFAAWDEAEKGVIRGLKNDQQGAFSRRIAIDVGLLIPPEHRQNVETIQPIQNEQEQRDLYQRMMIAECLRLQHEVFDIELPDPIMEVIKKKNEPIPDVLEIKQSGH